MLIFTVLDFLFLLSAFDLTFRQERALYKCAIIIIIIKAYIAKKTRLILALESREAIYKFILRTTHLLVAHPLFILLKTFSICGTLAE